MYGGVPEGKFQNTLESIEPLIMSLRAQLSFSLSNLIFSSLVRALVTSSKTS